MNTQTPSEEKKIQEEMQASLCALLHEIILKLGHKIVENNFADPLMATFLRLIAIQNKAVMGDALMAVGSVANTTETQFARYFPHFVPYITTILQTTAEHEIFIVAVGVVGDIARALGQRFSPYCAGIIKMLLNAFELSDEYGTIRPPIISALGDVAVSVGAAFLPHLSEVMHVLQSTSNTKLVDPNNEDEINFINELRESVCEAYTGILQGLHSCNRSADLIPYVQPILLFMALAIPESTKTENLYRGMVGLIGDLALAVCAYSIVITHFVDWCAC